MGLQNIIITAAWWRKSWVSSQVAALVPSRKLLVLPRSGEEWPVGTQDCSLVPGVTMALIAALAQGIKDLALLLQWCPRNSNNRWCPPLNWSHNSNKFNLLPNKTSAITSNRKMRLLNNLLILKTFIELVTSVLARSHHPPPVPSVQTTQWKTILLSLSSSRILHPPLAVISFQRSNLTQLCKIQWARQTTFISSWASQRRQIGALTPTTPIIWFYSRLRAKM